MTERAPVAPVVYLADVRRYFDTGVEVVRAVDGVDFEVSPGRMVCVYGASGSGKSTLLNLIAGLDLADSGRVEVVSKDLNQLSATGRSDMRLKQVGVIFQDNNLVAEFSASDNVVIPLMAAGKSRVEALDEAHSWFDRLGIGELFDRMPANMSGGQRQRVGIARALAGGKVVLLADEPTGALDSESSKSLFSLIAGLCRESGIAAVVATHDPLAQEYADAIYHMVDGKISQS